MTWNPEWSRQYSQPYNIPTPNVSVGNIGYSSGVTIPESQRPPTSTPIPQPEVTATPSASTQPVAPQASSNPYEDPLPDFKPGFRLINPKPQVPAQDPVSPPQNEVPVVQQPPAPVYTPPVTQPPPVVTQPVVSAPAQVPSVVNPIVLGGGHTTMEMNPAVEAIGNPDRGGIVTMPGLSGPSSGQSGIGDGSNLSDPYNAEVPEIRTVDTSSAGDELIRAEDQEIGGIKINRYFGSQIR